MQTLSHRCVIFITAVASYLPNIGFLKQLSLNGFSQKVSVQYIYIYVSCTSQEQ